MFGSVTIRQRLNRLLCLEEFRLYKYLWKRLCDGELDKPHLSLPGMIEKFGALQ